MFMNMFITVGTLPQLIGFIRFGVVHIWLLQKLINHMWEGTLTDVGLAPQSG